MKRDRDRGKSMTAVITLGFAVLILIGTFLLMMPISSAEGKFTPFCDSLFTATSSTCVTGLIVCDTATHWSIFGQCVILALIQIGGIGFMSLAVMLSILIKRSISPHERMLVMQSYNMNTYERPLEFVKRIFGWTFSMELLGAMVLAFRFIPDFGVVQGIYKSIFHSISAFCNAGFDMIGVGNPAITSMGYYSEDVLVNVTLMCLIVAGGVGFVVINDLIGFVRSRKRLGVYTKLVLIITCMLILFGAVGYALFEWNNPQTLGYRSVGNKILASFFQSITLRTAGFSMIDNALTTSGSQFLALLLMFIGGASGSTAGGVKVVTMGILIYTVYSVAIGRKSVSIFGRRVSNDSFMRAVSIVCIQFFLVVVATFMISASTNADIMNAVFEVVSAGGTVGVSLGLTPTLDLFSKFVIIFLMYFGRVGILSITYTLTLNIRDKKSVISYPEANLLIG